MAAWRRLCEQRTDLPGPSRLGGVDVRSGPRRGVGGNGAQPASRREHARDSALLIVLGLMVFLVNGALVVVFFSLLPGWVRAVSNRVPVSIFALLALRLRRVPVRLVVDACIQLRNEGCPAGIAEVEEAYRRNRGRNLTPDALAQLVGQHRDAEAREAIHQQQNGEGARPDADTNVEAQRAAGQRAVWHRLPMTPRETELAQLDDPIASRTEWSEFGGDYMTPRSHELVASRPDRVEFRGLWRGKAMCAIPVLVGVGPIIGASVQLALSFIRNHDWETLWGRVCCRHGHCNAHQTTA